MTDPKIMNAIREIATNLQVGDARRAHAQMEILAIFAEVRVSTIYAVAEEVAAEATEGGLSARDYALDDFRLKDRLVRLELVAA
ncbi:hypothetical protein LCM08_06300 [Salipiger pacificus]|nr:hypothetical protein [Alloyangia pacifica]